MTCREALQTVLDCVDYTNGACRPNELVGACLPMDVIAIAKKAIQEDSSATVAKVAGVGRAQEAR